jgi:gamma-glutamylcyclotransferase (GGCT)/AIG2-like uncharacterized protein YtfP
MLIAVYGSLKEGCYNHPYFLKDSEKKGVMTVPGKLFSFGAFPGLVYDKEKGDAVEVEVYDVSEKIQKDIHHMETGAGYYRSEVATPWGSHACIWYYKHPEYGIRIIPEQDGIVRWREIY